MNEFLASLKSDLLDRRLLPILALLGAAVIAAVAYAALGGSSSPTPTTGAAAPTRAPGIAVSQVQGSPTAAVAETTTGAALQRKGSARDPFELLSSPLASAEVKSVSAGQAPASSSSAAGAGASTGSETTQSAGSGGSGGSGSAGKGETKPSAPAKKVTTHYTVAVQFGSVPVEALPGTTVLQGFPSLKLNEPLPAQAPVLVYRGVLAKSGKQAVFALTGETIVRGLGKCVPSATLCQGIVLEPGQYETLEGFQADGTPLAYELRVTSITKTVTTASSAAVSGRTAQLAQRVLEDAGVAGSLHLPFAP